MPFDIRKTISDNVDSLVQTAPLNIDVSNELDDVMRGKFESLLWKVSNFIEQKKENFLREILEYKDRLWFWAEVWRCMMQVEYLIEWNSRNKALCVAFIDQDLNLEKIDFSEKTPELA